MNPTTEAISSSDSWLRMSLALGFVIGLVFLSAWLLKRISAGRMIGGLSARGGIKILDKTSLGDKRYLMVVRVEGKYLLLGVTQQSVSLVSELPQYTLQEEEKEPLFERIFHAASRKAEEIRK